MKRAIMTAPGTIAFREVLKPKPRSNEVLIQIKRIGICGSDIHVFHGIHPYTIYPVVQGHEASGTIAAIGSKVKGLEVGDQVVFMPQVTCGRCYPCRHGMPHICENLKVMGFQTAGAAQEYFPVDRESVLKLPSSISLEQAAMIEPISVAVHALSRGGNVKDRKVLIFGAGTIGNLVGQVARAYGAAQVMLFDVNDYRLQKARECGIEFVGNLQKEDVTETILKYLGPDKADLIFECVGVQETITQILLNARKGTTVVVVGVFGKKPTVDLGLVQDHELSVVGTLMYQKHDYERAIELVAHNQLCLSPMITHRFSFSEYLDAYKTIENAKGNVLKVMITL